MHDSFSGINYSAVEVLGAPPYAAQSPSVDSSAKAVIDFYRCPPVIPDFTVDGTLKGPHGFFRFGQSLVCYGQSTGSIHSTADGRLFDASKHIHRNGTSIALP